MLALEKCTACGRRTVAIGMNGQPTICLFSRCPTNIDQEKLADLDSLALSGESVNERWTAWKKPILLYPLLLVLGTSSLLSIPLVGQLVAACLLNIPFEWTSGIGFTFSSDSGNLFWVGASGNLAVLSMGVIFTVSAYLLRRDRDLLSLTTLALGASLLMGAAASTALGYLAAPILAPVGVAAGFTTGDAKLGWKSTTLIMTAVTLLAILFDPLLGISTSILIYGGICEMAAITCGYLAGRAHATRIEKNQKYFLRILGIHSERSIRGTTMTHVTRESS